MLALTALASALLILPSAAPASPDTALVHNTFSIIAVDPETGESGVATTTRVACVGNAVPHVRAGIGAVATQSWTRVEYGAELLDMLAEGIDPQLAMERAIAADEGRERRQVGVIGLDGESALFTGGETTDWAGHRAGRHHAVLGNLLVGPEVIEAVSAAFEGTERSGRHLSDRLIEALAAGQAAGGDARKGRVQSAAVIVADPREGRSRRPEGVTADINVCEHPEPVAELRRIHDTITERLGFRTLAQQRGNDVWQLRVMLNALGHYRPDADRIDRDAGAFLYTQPLVEAVEAFRESEGLATAALGSPAGLVDGETVERLWRALEDAGRADGVRDIIREHTAVLR
jgi:uncharacterized Ntn-hydrolase superfamily protein